MEIRNFKLNFGTIDVRKNHIVCVPNFDADMGVNEALAIIDLASKHFIGPWGYISNRINNHSVNPLLYSQLAHHPHKPCAIAIICYTEGCNLVSQIERKAMESAVDPGTIDFSVFTDLPHAEKWMESILARRSVKK